MKEDQAKDQFDLLTFQFGVIFVLTYVLTFFLFPVVLWVFAQKMPEEMGFWQYLKGSYLVGLYPAWRVFSRAVLVSGLLIIPVVKLLKNIRFNRLGFAFGSATVVFVTGFIAVIIQRGLFVEGRSVMTTLMGFSLVLSLTGAACCIIAAAFVIQMDIKDDNGSAA